MLYATASVTLDPISNDNGILLLKQGQLLRQTDYFSLACVYNITDIKLALVKVMALYASTENADNSLTSGYSYKSYKDQILYSIGLINKKLAYLIPPVRVKRGIINGLGTIVKTITGNLDNDDAVKFEKEISDINKKINRFQNSQKKSLILAESIINEFGSQISKLEENQKNVVKILQNNTQNSNGIIDSLHFLDIYIQIDLSLQIILEKLMTLEDAVTFVQLGTYASKRYQSTKSYQRISNFA